MEIESFVFSDNHVKIFQLYIYIYIAKKDEKLEHDKGEMFA